MVDPVLGVAQIHEEREPAVGIAHVVHAQLRREVLKLAVPVGDTKGADVVALGKEHLEDGPAQLQKARGVGHHVHPLLHGGGAGRNEPSPQLRTSTRHNRQAPRGESPSR